MGSIVERGVFVFVDVGVHTLSTTWCCVDSGLCNLSLPCMPGLGISYYRFLLPVHQCKICA